MTEKILCVDDEANVLAGFQRSLRKQFQLETAQGGEAALAMLEKGGAFAVIVSDMRMPGLNGLQLLQRVKQRWPDAVRVMLTGNADQQTAMDAVNEGSIFRFLTKPCPPERLAATLTAALEQHRLITAERELLENTLNGSVRALTDILSLLAPETFGRGQQLREQMRAVAESLKLPEVWALELAAMLHGLGQVTLPAEVATRARLGAALSAAEETMVRRVPEVGSNLLLHIPRLETVARIVLFQSKHFDGTGFPLDPPGGMEIPAGARLLKVLVDLAQLEQRGSSRREALALMRERGGWYDPQLLDAVAAVLGAGALKPTAGIAFKDLKPGQVLVADVITKEGLLILAAGNRITPSLLERLRNFAALSGVREPIYVEA
ncbi:MAG: Response regulator containing a CheY-like receiver domain and an HD-GYP domain [Limisphaerales bacterium]|nr:MAG: Response regulator containing a CheY-like receiver domain and an HD-GYP domain [Limisphaerales bacterium]KAG0507674.1 MAG: Response regulator containing a CheY-like receiver domain and an HD-GYP domain [Limisphaerales bacterium]TXT51793.1 MAG: Response regulator containing a CheY-like receiver domain and an HD-GYP domain [Limisphaerales bacterium]